MKVDVDILSPIQRKIHIEVPGQAVRDEFSRVYGALSQRAKIKGFRPGKVPRTVLEGIYGDEAKSQTLSRLVEQSLREAVREKGLQVVSPPEVEPGELVEGNPFTFSAVVEIKPEIELKKYLGLEVERIKIEVEEKQVDEALSGFQESHAHLQPVEDRDGVEKGDCVVLDFSGTVNGKPFPGSQGENALLEVDGKSTLAQFEEALIGLKKNMDHQISVTYPKEYGNAELAGKAVDFRVHIKDIKKKILPPLDDDFAKDHGECETLTELKNKIRERLESELKEIQNRELREQLLTQLIESHSFDVPTAMVDRQLQYLMERRQRPVQASGSNAPQSAPSAEELRKELTPQAQRQVQTMLLVEKVGEQEKIDVTDQDVQQRIDEVVRSVGDKGSVVRDFYRRGEARDELRSQMVFDKTLNFLLENAKVKETESAKTKVDEGRKKR
ncbi:MAG: trigger factor [Deltaproteobacteria bacterium]|nr:trigger factor [Deltaproteobacteria bacterium]